MKLWVCGQSFSDLHPQAWDFQGVYDSEEKAVSACKTENFWVSEVEMNQESPLETVLFEICYYPFHNYETDEWETEPKIRTGYKS